MIFGLLLSILALPTLEEKLAIQRQKMEHFTISSEGTNTGTLSSRNPKQTKLVWTINKDIHGNPIRVSQRVSAHPETFRPSTSFSKPRVEVPIPVLRTSGSHTMAPAHPVKAAVKA